MPSSIYSNTLTLGEALGEYLSRFGLGDGGYRDPKFTIPFFWVFALRLPNIRVRVEAVKIHDLHHVLAEYPTGLLGEAEIGAWEIASGCGKYWPAWILNFGSFLYGVVRHPSETFHAFVRGRHSDNLYHQADYKEVLGRSIGEIRQRLHMSHGIPSSSMSDIVSFACWSVVSFVTLALPFLAVIYFTAIILH